MGRDHQASAEGGGEPAGAYVARAELLLARADRLPLRRVPLQPDPLTGLARAMAAAREDLGERVEVVVDLLPMTAGDRRRRRRAAVAADAERARRAGGLSETLFAGEAGQALSTVIWGGGASRPRRGRGGRVSPPGLLGRDELAREARAVGDKVLGVDPAFWLQVLVRCESRVAGRHAALLQAAVASFEAFAGENYLRQRGQRVSHFFVGPDTPGRRWWFDRRWATGLHRRRPHHMATASELAGLLKPPTRHCDAPNVARSGGLVPAPPRGLPTFVGQPELLPLGWVATEAGDRPVGVRRDESPFTYNAGRTGAGKTSSALARAISTFRAGYGGMFLDPHGDGVALLKQYLTDRRNVVELNLGDPGLTRQAGWNLFSMERCRPRDVEAKVSAVVDSFSAALGWGETTAPRALTLVTMGAQALCELAMRLPPGLAPTIFQLPTLLADEAWRGEVIGFVSPHTREFFTTRFGRMDANAITPVTNLIDRLRASPTVAALLGSSRSTYDVRRAMDTGQVVLASINGTGAWANLVASFITYDLFRAAMSRRELPPARRREFWAWVDELQRISGTGSGTAGESVARALEEARKMGLRLQLMSQQPDRLAKPTLAAILTNRSHLFSHVVGAEAAKKVADEWGGAVAKETITRLARFEFIAQVTLNGKVTLPFKARGFDPESDEPWASLRRPAGLGQLERRIDANLRRRPVADVLAELDTLNDRIAEHLGSLRAAPAPGAEPLDPGPRPPRAGRGSGHLVLLDGDTDTDPATGGDGDGPEVGE